MSHHHHHHHHHGGPNQIWRPAAESQYFVLREHHSGGDHRIAFSPGVYKDFGNPHGGGGGGTRVFESHGNWSIGEENGILVIRDRSSPGDHRYAFYPGCGNGNNFGNPGPRVPGAHHTYHQGSRWTIREEDGVLVFRDHATPGDHRYAFFPSCGNTIYM